MPTPIDAHSSAKNPLIIEAAKSALANFATTVLAEVAIVAPTSGYRMYNKRVALATLVVHNPSHYAGQAAVMIEQVTNGSAQEAVNMGATLSNYMIEQNPIGKSIFEANAFSRNNVADVGRVSGVSIFDALAGVNTSDLI